MATEAVPPKSPSSSEQASARTAQPDGSEPPKHIAHGGSDPGLRVAQITESFFAAFGPQQSALEQSLAKKLTQDNVTQIIGLQTTKENNRHQEAMARHS